MIGKTVQAIVGGIYHDKVAIAVLFNIKGGKESRKFITDYLMSREIDIESLIPLKNPKTILINLLNVKNKEAPESRYFH